MRALELALAAPNEEGMWSFKWNVELQMVCGASTEGQTFMKVQAWA